MQISCVSSPGCWSWWRCCEASSSPSRLSHCAGLTKLEGFWSRKHQQEDQSEMHSWDPKIQLTYTFARMHEEGVLTERRVKRKWGLIRPTRGSVPCVSCHRVMDWWMDRTSRGILTQDSDSREGIRECVYLCVDEGREDYWIHDTRYEVKARCGSPESSQYVCECVKWDFSMLNVETFCLLVNEGHFRSLCSCNTTTYRMIMKSAWWDREKVHAMQFGVNTITFAAWNAINKMIRLSLSSANKRKHLSRLRLLFFPLSSLISSVSLFLPFLLCV